MWEDGGTRTVLATVAHVQYLLLLESLLLWIRRCRIDHLVNGGGCGGWRRSGGGGRVTVAAIVVAVVVVGHGGGSEVGGDGG